MMSLPRQLLVAHPPPAALPMSMLCSLGNVGRASARSAARSPYASPAAYRAIWHHRTTVAPRTFSSSSAAQVASKRPLVTAATAIRAEPAANLDDIPSPPRNADAPAVPGVHDVRPPAGLSSPRPAAHLEQHQQPEPAPVTTSSETAEKKPRPKSKLRPLRAALKLTPTAVAHIKELLDQPEPKLLRIGTRRRGCSGLAYHLEYVDKADKFDEVVKQDGVEVLVEGRALLTVLGSTMDWVDEKLGSRFVFTNPNIKEQCGCGESFMV